MILSSLMKNHFQRDSDLDVREVLIHPNPNVTVFGLKCYDKADCIVVPIVDVNDTSVLNLEYYYCTICKGKWKKIAGTIGNINHHLKAKHANLAALPADTQLSAADRIKLGKKFVLLNGLPFSLIEDEYFGKLCPGIGKRKALSDSCSTIAAQIRNAIKVRLTAAINIWVTFDEWSDAATQEYLGVHAFALFNDSVKHYCIALQPLVVLNLDAAYISIVLSEIFDDYNILAKIKGFVTDSAPVMIATAHNFGDGIKWIPCFCHIMNNLMGKFITASEAKLSYLFKLQRSLGSSCLFHNFVVQDSTIRVSSLPSYTYTRWYSMFKLLRNTLILKDKIVEFIPLYNEKHPQNIIELPEDSFFEQLAMLINVIATARNAMMTLESDEFGTISKVIDCFAMLKSTVDSLDDNIWGEEKTVFYNGYQSLYETQYEENKDLLLVASRLNPYIMSGTIISAADKQFADDLILAMISARRPQHEAQEQARQARIRAQHPNQPETFGLTMGVFSASHGTPVAANELTQYITLIPNNVHEGDVLKFWNDNNRRLPVLANIAREYLVTPATSGASERDFSKAKRTASVRRLAMKRSKVSDTVMIAANPEIADAFIQ